MSVQNNPVVPECVDAQDRAPTWEVTVKDLDAVRFAIINGGNYREDINCVAQNVDWLARTAINALISRGWVRLDGGEAVHTQEDPQPVLNPKTDPEPSGGISNG